MYHKYFTMSYDDGVEQDKRLIQLMNQYGIKGTFNLNAGLLGLKQRVAYKKDQTLSVYSDEASSGYSQYKNTDFFRIAEDEIAAVYSDFEVASHAFLHEALGEISSDEMKNAIDQDIAKLESILMKPILGHAYAFGSTSSKTKAYLAKKGLNYARGVVPTYRFDPPQDCFDICPTCSHSDIQLEILIERFIATPKEEMESDLIFYLWGHSYELDYATENVSWERIERVFKRLANSKDIIFCTNGQLFTKKLD